MLAQRDRVIARHPRTTFIGAHLGDNGEDLAALDRRLVRYPNFVVDLSAREAELGRQPYTARRFLIRWQDRVLFGTDRYPGRLDQPRHRLYYRLLETEDEYFKYYDHPFPPTGEWRVYGLHLPDGVLRKIYQSNADRVARLAGARPRSGIRDDASVKCADGPTGGHFDTSPAVTGAPDRPATGEADAVAASTFTDLPRPFGEMGRLTQT